jgi:carotenoid 1,2-hydratase
VLWAGDVLEIRVAEITAPWPSRLRGVVRVHPRAVTAHSFALDAAGRHRWRPLAPFAHVEVDFESPRLRWRGDGYLDSNIGDEPLERGFSNWHWSRAAHREAAAVLYDATPRAGEPLSLALHFDRHGEVEHREAPRPAALPKTGWGIARATRADDGAAQLRSTLENAPFYARSLVESRLFGVQAAAVHESLDLDRFASPFVQWMLPFRMPRVAGSRRREPG